MDGGAGAGMDGLANVALSVLSQTSAVVGMMAVGTGMEDLAVVASSVLSQTSAAADGLAGGRCL